MSGGVKKNLKIIKCCSIDTQPENWGMRDEEVDLVWSTSACSEQPIHIDKVGKTLTNHSSTAERTPPPKLPAFVFFQLSFRISGVFFRAQRKLFARRSRTRLALRFRNRDVTRPTAACRDACRSCTGSTKLSSERPRSTQEQKKPRQRHRNKNIARTTGIWHVRRWTKLYPPPYIAFLMKEEDITRPRDSQMGVGNGPYFRVWELKPHEWMLEISNDEIQWMDELLIKQLINLWLMLWLIDWQVICLSLSSLTHRNSARTVARLTASSSHLT